VPATTEDILVYIQHEDGKGLRPIRDKNGKAVFTSSAAHQTLDTLDQHAAFLFHPKDLRAEKGQLIIPLHFHVLSTDLQSEAQCTYGA